MNLRELLIEIGSLGVCDARDWEGYIRYFDGCEDLASSLPQRADAGLRPTLLDRIRQHKGAEPARLDPGASPKIVAADFFCDEGIRKSMTLGIVSGADDLLHLGHVRSMVSAKRALSEHPNPVLCALTLSDEAVRAKRGPTRPVPGLNERVGMLCGARCVDCVVALTEPDCLAALHAARPDLFFKDSPDNAQAIVREEQALVASLGGRVVTFPPETGRTLSTTDLVSKVLRRERVSEQTDGGT